MKQGIKGLFKDMIFSMKSDSFVRFILKPFYNYSRNRRTERYLASKDAENIRVWKDAFGGKRCWIIGNGPSLTVDDIEHLDKEITFASNRIYHLYDRTKWRPNFYVAFEPEFIKANMDTISHIEVRDARFINNCGKQDMYETKDNYWLNCTCKFMLKKLTTENIEFSEDISLRVNDAYSVTYTILQLAFYMGFSEIYLLGVDHYKNNNQSESAHFYRDNKNEYKTPTYLEGIEYRYHLARQVAEKRGVKIFNATRGGNLEVFERVDTDSTLQTIN